MLNIINIMTKLIIVESPAKCKKIEGYLGKGYKCIASFGHIRQLNNGLKSIDIPNNYGLDFKLIPSKSKYIKNLKKYILKTKPEDIILATDDDREGEAIAWHICKAFNLSIINTKRIIFHEITKPAILKSLNNIKRIDMNKVKSQQSRMILDILVGYRVSPLLWKSVGSNNNFNLSAGRCQTPALKIIYEQEQIINNSKHKSTYDIMGKFIKHDLDFKLNKKIDNEDSIIKFLNESKVHEYTYNISNPKVVEKKCPLPLSTSILQQKSSNELGYSPKQTMRIAQTLYEQGLITYMRTDNRKYSPEFIESSKEYINNKYGNEYINKHISNISLNNKNNKDKDKLAQEAHEAIRPTDITKDIIYENNKITNKEIRLYKLIWKITVESCMSSAFFYQIKTIISAPLEYKYSRTDEKVKFLGWKILENINMDNSIYEMLLNLKDDVLELYNIYCKSTIDNIKLHYTEAKLISMLEKRGIGRPSTFSSIITKIQDRGYVKKQHIEGKELSVNDYELTSKTSDIKKIINKRKFGNERNKLKLQSLGKLVMEYLLNNINNIFDYDYTKNMENRLDKIANGIEDWSNLCNDCNNELVNQIKKINKSSVINIKIDKHHTYTIAKYGPVIKYVNGDKTTFKRVRKDIDIEKLKAGNYSLEELLDNTYKTNVLGTYDNEDIVIKNGRYGMYTSFKGKNISLKGIKKKIEDINLNDVIKIIKNNKSNNKILKEINQYASVRVGKYGPYIYYKTKGMSRPRFIKVPKNYKLDDLTERWLNNIL